MDRRRKGFATEALKAALSWGASHLKSDRAVCIINAGNLASIRVAEKCGFQEVQRTTHGGNPTILFSKALP